MFTSFEDINSEPLKNTKSGSNSEWAFCQHFLNWNCTFFFLLEKRKTSRCTNNLPNENAILKFWKHSILCSKRYLNVSILIVLFIRSYTTASECWDKYIFLKSSFESIQFERSWYVLIYFKAMLEITISVF